MGGSISIQKGSNAAAEQFLKNEMAKLFAEEFEKLKESNLCQSELRQNFLDAINRNEFSIWNRLDAIKNAPPKLKKQLSDTDGMADFRELCVKTVEKIHMKNAHTWMCAVDGRDSSEAAFTTTMRLRRRVDHICLYHVFDGNNNALPDDLREESVRKKFEGQLLHVLPVNRFSFYWQAHTGSLKEGITDLVQESQRAILTNTPPPRVLPDFFVMGFSKTNTSNMFPQTPDAKPGGSYASFVLRSLPFPCIIAKRACPDGPKSFIMAVDDSDTSKRGFDMLLQVMSPRDSLRCVHVQSHESDKLPSLKSADGESGEATATESGGVGGGEGPSDEDRKRWRQEIKDDMLRRAPMDSEYVMVDCGPGEDVAATLVRFVNSAAPDFFAIAPRTRTSVQLSAMSEYVLENIEASIILCKN